MILLYISTREIDKLSEHLAKMANMTKNFSEQVAASASEQSIAINELASDSNELYPLSSNLKDEIRKFKFDKTE